MIGDERILLVAVATGVFLQESQRNATRLLHSGNYRLASAQEQEQYVKEQKKKEEIREHDTTNT